MDLVEKIAKRMFFESSGNDEINEDGEDVWAAIGNKREYWIDLARSAISCLEENGMVVVPREPTKEMIRKGEAAFDEYLTDPDGTVLTYQAMLSASPKG